MADFHPLEYAGKHPITVGAVVFVGGLGVLYMMGAFSGGGNSGAANNANEVQGYFAAESAQAQAGDQVDIAALTTQAATAQTYLNDNANMNINTTWANAQTSMNANTNAATLAEAPYAVQASVAGALGQIASQPPTTVTNTSKSSGLLFGLLGGGGTKTTTSVVPNPAATAAAEALANMFNPAH